MEAMKTIELEQVTLKIMPDCDDGQDCPLENSEENGVLFVSFEKRSTLSDMHDFNSPDEVAPYAKKNGYQVFNLRKYEHGDVAYSISTGYPFNDRWDSGQVGFVLVKKKMFRGEKRRQEIAESWCKSVTIWCNGWYYGFVVENKDGDHLDSCWGFDDMDYCEEEGMSSAKHYNEKEMENAASEQEETRPDMYQQA